MVFFFLTLYADEYGWTSPEILPYVSHLIRGRNLIRVYIQNQLKSLKIRLHYARPIKEGYSATPHGKDHPNPQDFMVYEIQMIGPWQNIVYTMKRVEPLLKFFI